MIRREYPRRCSRREVNYTETNDEDDPGFLFDINEKDYVKCIETQPERKYEVSLGGDPPEIWTEEEFKRRLYPDWLEYVNLRVGKRLTTEVVYRFYLNLDEGDDVEMNIDYIVFPSDADVANRRMAAGVYLGGEMKPGSSTVEEWFPIQLHSISMVNLIAVVEDLRAQGLEISDEEKRELYSVNVVESTNNDEARFHITLNNPWKITDLLDKYCVQKPGRRIRVSGPGFRTVGKEKSHLQIHDLRLFVGGMEGLCMYTGILNAIWLSCGEDYASRVLRTKQLVTCRDLRQLSRSVLLWASHVSLRIPPFCTAVETTVDMQWLQDQKEGVFIANIMGTNGVNHVICLDFNRKWIADGAEHHPLRLCPDSLHACCGKGNHFLRFKNIREVNGSGNFKRTKKARNRSHKERKRAKARKRAVLESNV